MAKAARFADDPVSSVETGERPQEPLSPDLVRPDVLGSAEAGMGPLGSAATATGMGPLGSAATAAGMVQSSTAATVRHRRRSTLGSAIGRILRTMGTVGTMGTAPSSTESSYMGAGSTERTVGPKRGTLGTYVSKQTQVTTLSQYTVESKFAVSWKDLSYTAQTKHGAKTILQKQSGHILPGQLVALMGPSGSGKTTLLDSLADRVKKEHRHGEILIGNMPRDDNSRKIVSYVGSEEALLSAFTVQETLQYTAMFVLPNLTRAERADRVAGVLETMGLQSCADAKVGDAIIKGISNGQKRRLSIALGKLSRAPILFLDEPTSGLDADAAFQIVKYMKGAAQKMHTVAMSIHQPNSKTFRLFDVVSILAKGRQIYLGPVKEAMHYFESIGHSCPPYMNPADFYIELVDTDFGNKTDDLLIELSEEYLKSDVYKRHLEQEIETLDPRIYTKSVRDATYWQQFWAILLRMLHMNVKNPFIWTVRIFMYIGLCGMVGSMYLGVGNDATCNVNDAPRGRGPTSSDDCFCDPARLRAAQSLLPYIYSISNFLINLSVAILPFFLEIRDVFRRERSNGQIMCFPYVLADFFANLPGITIIAAASSAICVFLPGMNNVGGFFLNLFLTLIVAENFMRMVGVAQPHYIIGMAGACGMYAMFMFVQGFVIRSQDIKPYWFWAHKIGFHSYTFEWFIHNQFSGDAGFPCGQPILEDYYMDDVDPSVDVLVLVAWAVVSEIGFFLVLFFKHTGRR